MERCAPISNYYVGGGCLERYALPLDELKTIRMALERWAEQIETDGDYRTDALMAGELETTKRLIRRIHKRRESFGFSS